MGVPYYGDFAEDDTVNIPFNTFDSNDPSASVTITDLADSDIKVHKDGGTTEIATDGATVAINFDARTGAHLITIDTSAHSDYSTGSEYAVLIEGTTVDGATITAWVGAFSIERAGGALALLKLIQTAVITNAVGADVSADIATAQADLDILTGADGAILNTTQSNYAPNVVVPATKAEMDTAHGLLATEAKQDIIDTNVDQIETAVITNAAGTDIAADIIEVKAETANILTDTGTTIPGTITTAQNDLNILTGADGAILNTTQSNYAPNVVVPATKAEMDTAHALLATPAQVNAQVLDVMNVDTFAEPGQGAPGATISIFAKINYLYKSWRNKKDNDGSTTQLYNDAGAVVDQKQTTSEAAGTATKAEWETGA